MGKHPHADAVYSLVNSELEHLWDRLDDLAREKGIDDRAMDKIIEHGYGYDFAGFYMEWKQEGSD